MGNITFLKRKNHNLSLYVIVTLMCLMLVSCVSSTKVESGTIIGTVLLDEESDHSDIIVSIYKANVVSQELKDINLKYPNIGFHVNDSIMFDHRISTPIKRVSTSINGAFSFDKMPYGEYIIVYEKEGWGYNYRHNVVLKESELDVSKDGTLKLYKEIVLPAYIDDSIVFESNKTYVALSDVTVGPAGSLVFNDNSRLLLGPGVKISSHGSIVSPEGGGRGFVSSYIVDLDNLALYRGNGVSVLGGEADLKNISFSLLYGALEVSLNECTLSMLSFVDCQFGLKVLSCDDMSTSNCVILKNNENNSIALEVYNVQGFDLHDNLFYDNGLAIKQEITKDAMLWNNVLINNAITYQHLWESESIFRNNYIETTGTGIENSGKSNLEILYNDISAKDCVKTYHSHHSTNTVSRGWTKANNNNFQASQYVVESKAHYSYSGGPYPLDFKNNYWGTSNSAEIDELIIDYYDLGLDIYPGLVSSVVEYIPFKRSKVVDAGIE